MSDNFASANPVLSYKKNYTYQQYDMDDDAVESPAFNKYQEMDNSGDGSKYYCGGNSSLALRSFNMENTKVSIEFFSPENIERIQRKIKFSVKEMTQGKFRMDADQDEMELITVMGNIYAEYGKHIDHGIKRQVKELNKMLLDHIMPDIVTNIQQYYGYIKEINSPLQPIARPLNVNRAGRKTLPSMTSVWGI